MFGLEVIQSEWKMSKVRTRAMSRPRKRAKPKVKTRTKSNTKIHTDGNPITPLSEKSQVIFGKVIPTIRKIQEKKYWTEGTPGKQSEIDRRVNPHIKRLRRMIGTESLEVLSKKGLKDLNNFLYERLKNLPEITATDLKNLKREAISIIIKVRNSKFKNNRISKKEAKQRIVMEELEDYNLLKAKDKRNINTIINYNLALVNSKSFISFEEYKALLNTIVTEFHKLNLRYVVAEKFKSSLLSEPRTKQLLSYMSDIEQKKLIKFLDRSIRESNIYSSKSQDAIKKQFVLRLLGLGKKHAQR